MQVIPEQLVAGIARAREEARVCVDQAVAVAEEFAILDTDLQATRDSLQRAKLANALRYTAGACEIAEQRAILAVFTLRMQERALEDAHALLFGGQRGEVEQPGCSRAGRGSVYCIGREGIT